MTRLLLVLAAAFLLASGIAAYEHQALKAEKATVASIKTQRDDYKNAANNNAYAAYELGLSLDECQRQILSTVDANKHALEDQRAKYETLDKALAAAKSKLNAPQCTEWAKQPACPDLALQ
jgi:hypothetical protein